MILFYSFFLFAVFADAKKLFAGLKAFAGKFFAQAVVEIFKIIPQAVLLPYFECLIKFNDGSEK